MVRGVSQLLFNYLPERTVDWEDGLAIVQLGAVQLGDAWPVERARVVLEEIAQLLDRWRELGGTVDPNFPDPRRSEGRFTTGTPKAIDAAVLETAYLCQGCYTLVFPRRGDLRDGVSLRCRVCGAAALHQFGQVFVHGCGELVPLQEFIPIARTRDDGSIEPAKRRLRCERCGDVAALEIPARSERVADMKIICRGCRAVVLNRMTASCPRCTAELAHQRRDQGPSREGSPFARIAMRMSRYSANDTYYPQTLTLLRLDRPALTLEQNPEQLQLHSLLPLDARLDTSHSQAEVIAALTERLLRAEEIGDEAERTRVLNRIAAVATGGGQSQQERRVQESPVPTASDVPKAIRESLAFGSTVTRYSALDLVSGSSAGQPIAQRAAEIQRSLGLREIALVNDLPVISATFGYTRRSFQPTYDELSAQSLPTQIRVFPSLDTYSANRLGRQDLVGTVPILAREGEHQGLFISLNPERVVAWLGRNGIELPEEGAALPRILTALEAIDRYYDHIWECRVRRLVFGLVHTLSHVLMRSVSWFAGLERTSISEYLFLPLLGTVVFDASGAFQLGGIETLVRDHLMAFLEQLPTDALACIYDPDCIDGRGACHGCVHSPEIACRVFNHGLSRAFLIGGHVPWLDLSADRQLLGYWQASEDS